MAHRALGVYACAILLHLGTDFAYCANAPTAKPAFHCLTEGIAVRVASVEEPRVAKFTADTIEAVLKYLDDGAHAWMRKKKYEASCMTAFAIMRPREIGVPASAPCQCNGIAWSKREQRVGGRWWDAIVLSRQISFHDLHRHLPGPEGPSLVWRDSDREARNSPPMNFSSRLQLVSPAGATDCRSTSLNRGRHFASHPVS